MTRAPVDRTNGVDGSLFDVKLDSVGGAAVDVSLAPAVLTFDALRRSIPSLEGDCPVRAINSFGGPVGSAIRGGKADRIRPSGRREPDTDSWGSVVPSFERVALGIVPGVASKEAVVF
jgi:hypothetical protein